MSTLKKKIVLCLPIAFFIASCIVKDSKGDIKPTESPAINTMAIATETGTATPLPPTPLLSTSTPTLLPVVPALPEKEAYRLLFNMLSLGDTCMLPCWLNITPGKSSLVDTYFEWAPLQGITATYADFPVIDNGSMDFIYEMNSNNLKVFTNYSASHLTGIIESIDVFTEATHYLGNDQFENAYTTEIYKNNLSTYLLPNILSKYGPPPQIFLSMEIISAEPTSPDFFHVWLLYPAKGAIIEYTGSAEVNNNTIRGCPSDTFVSLWLVSSDDTILYQKTLQDATGAAWNDLATVSPFYKPTSEAIGMTSSEFYETFKKPTTRCVESSLNIWPQH